MDTINEPTKPLLVLPKGVSSGSISEARKAGYIVIVTDEPDKVKLITGYSEVSGGDLLMSALHGLCERNFSTGERSKMVEELFARMKAREKAKVVA